MDLFMLGLLQKMSRVGGKSVSHSSSYTINNTVDYPIVGLNLYGKSTQDGIPTPETPVDIVSVGDSGFDIISKDDTHFNLLSVRDNGGDIITKQPVSAVGKNGETKRFIVSANGSGLRYQWWQNVNNGNGWVIMNTEGARQPIFTIPVAAFRNGYRYRCVVTDSNGNSETSNEVTLYVVSDDCEVKMESIVTNALPLCGIPVDSGGNYTDNNGQQWVCDYVDFARGVKVQRIIGGRMYGTTNGWKWYLRDNSTEYYASEHPYISLFKNVLDTKAISNAFLSGAHWNSNNKNKIGVSNSSEAYVFVGASTFASLSELTSYLDSNEVYVYSELATPIETPLTEAELQAYRQLQTFDGVTNISNSDNADMDVKYCTDKSLSECVLPITMGLQKQIDELQDSMQKQIDELQASILRPGPLTIPGFFAETIIGPIITEGDE